MDIEPLPNGIEVWISEERTESSAHLEGWMSSSSAMPPLSHPHDSLQTYTTCSDDSNTCARNWIDCCLRELCRRSRPRARCHVRACLTGLNSWQRALHRFRRKFRRNSTWTEAVSTMVGKIITCSFFLSGINWRFQSQSVHFRLLPSG